MRKDTLRILTLAALAVAGLQLTACANTVHGAGQDIENAGEKVQETVD